MCGIFGVIDKTQKIDESRVLAARDILWHRGPDDSGIYHLSSISGYILPNVVIVNRPKMGFTFPFEDWMKNGKLKNYIANSINKSDIKLNILNSKLYIEKHHWSRN